MTNTPQNFWNFSLDLYDREGVAAACLALQSEYRLDVNLVLFCYWYGSCYGEIEERLLADAIAFSAHWRRHVVQPLRDTRSWMKLQAERSESFDALREGIKAEELAAEKYQQERIAGLANAAGSVEGGVTGSAASAENIDRLLRAMKIERDATIAARLLTISSALERETLAAR